MEKGNTTVKAGSSNSIVQLLSGNKKVFIKTSHKPLSINSKAAKKIQRANLAMRTLIKFSQIFF